MNGTTHPWAVVMQMRDGSTVEQVFATRAQADTFLYLRPLRLTTRPDGAHVARAILPPPPPPRPAPPPPAPARRRIDAYLQ